MRKMTILHYSGIDDALGTSGGHERLQHAEKRLPSNLTTPMIRNDFAMLFLESKLGKYGAIQ